MFYGYIRDKASWIEYHAVNVPSGQGGTMEVNQPMLVEGYLVQISKELAEKTYTPDKTVMLVPYDKVEAII